MSPAARDTTPASLVITSVVHVAHELARAAGTQEYLATPVLIPDISGQTAFTALDDAIMNHLPALAAVCARPHDRLGVEHVLVRAAQARRVPVAGLARLASHSEDWVGLRFGRIVPEKLLAQRYIEDFDFYENQIAAQLVDQLRRYIAQRISDLGKVERHLAGLGDYERALQDGHQSHWARDRLANLLAEAARESERQSVPVANALRWLSGLQAKVTVLRGTPAYRLANRHAAIPYRLRRTNLLTRDRRYHGAAQLWEAWALRRSADSDTLQKHQQEFPTAYSAYVTAIVLRACAILGLAPSGQTVPVPGGPPVEIGAADGIRLRIRAIGDGTVELSPGEVPVVRVVALPEDLTGSGSVAEASDAITALFARYREATVTTVIAYPGETTDRDKLPSRLRHLAHWAGPFPPDVGAPSSLRGIIPVTPLEIEGTERMARALRWAWYATWIQAAYPPHLLVPPWTGLPARDWLRASPRLWEILRPPTAGEMGQLEAEIGQWQADHVRSARAPHTTATGEGVTGDNVTSALRRAGDEMRQLATCPLCRESASVAFEARDRDTFHCRCECGGQWGTRVCGSCQLTFPVLWTGSYADYSTADDRDPYATGDQVDSLFGSEVLALPCPFFGDWTRFRCPWCGVCQGAPSCRCTAVAT